MPSFDVLATKESLAKTHKALKPHGVEVHIVENRVDALAKIKELIPSGVSVMNGTSKTLEQIGYIDYLATKQHPWQDLGTQVAAEGDPVKRARLRKLALLSDYYLGSVHAVTETGEFIVASNTGSQLPHIAFSSKNLILVVGAQKIVPTLTEAMQRLEEYVIPLEHENMQQKYGVGTNLSKLLIFKYENPGMGRSVRMILVKEKIGF